MVAVLALPVTAQAQAPEGVVVTEGKAGRSRPYAQAGVLELGGSTGFELADGYNRASFNPSVGYFVLDNIELSALMGLSQLNADYGSATVVSALIEPSIHRPLSRSLFGFVGLGMGVSNTAPGGTGFAMAPRLGANVLIARSGVLTPALQMTYATTPALPTVDGTLVRGGPSFGLSVGYTMMW
jgi:hypothetical protein